MTFRVALFAAAFVTVSGAAQAQTLQSRTLIDRVVVDIHGKPMPVVRTELARAAEAVCRSNSLFSAEHDAVCVDATYVWALRRAKLARAARAGTPDGTQVASR